MNAAGARDGDEDLHAPAFALKVMRENYAASGGRARSLNGNANRDLMRRFWIIGERLPGLHGSRINVVRQKDRMYFFGKTHIPSREKCSSEDHHQISVPRRMDMNHGPSQPHDSSIGLAFHDQSNLFKRHPPFLDEFRRALVNYGTLHGSAKSKSLSAWRVSQAPLSVTR
jgi:hypothetical protein